LTIFSTVPLRNCRFMVLQYQMLPSVQAFEPYFIGMAKLVFHTNKV